MQGTKALLFFQKNEWLKNYRKYIINMDNIRQSTHCPNMKENAIKNPRHH